jgi:hypothetical protein
VYVHRDTVPVRRDAHRLQADAVDTRAPTGRDEQAIATELPSVREFEDVAVALAPSCSRVRA